jgi:carbonic anhydrase
MLNFPDRLLNGYRNFIAGPYSKRSDEYRRLALDGQHPTALVIACCDSRAAPETIFDCGPGELFVLRNVANLVPIYEPDGGQHGTSAAIEFAIQSLGIAHIVVMGHGRCGGIRAALATDSTPLDAGDFIGKWMSLLGPAASAVSHYSYLTSGERETLLERHSIRNSIANLRTFPYIARLESEGKLALHGAWFDVSTGELWVMDPDTGDFVHPE